MRFKDFLTQQETTETPRVLPMPATWTGSQPPGSPGINPLDIGLPSVKRTGVIETLDKSKNPIFIHLSDGTKLYLTLDEFRRIKGRPEQGRKMTVVMQRRPDDMTPSPSQIQWAEVY